MRQVFDRHGQRIIIQVTPTGLVVLTSQGDRVFASPEEIDDLIKALLEARHKRWPWPSFAATEDDR